MVIRFVVASGHEATVRSLTRQRLAQASRFTAMTYDRLFRARSVRSGTYIFCDHERLSDLQLRLAAEAYRAINRAAPYARALNDPARVKTRYALLRALHHAGINQFDAYPADGIPQPRRFPVFIRSEAEHSTPLTPLLTDQSALDRSLADLVQDGIPLRGLIVIEYCAEPISPGVFRRFGTFRIGDRVHLDHIVTEDNWNVKHGKAGLVADDVYAADHASVVGNAFETELRDAFDIAGIAYGRADFGLVDGKPQIYEINTNPKLPRSDKPHSSALRQQTLDVAQGCFIANMTAIDLPDGARQVAIDGRYLRAYRAKFSARHVVTQRWKRFTGKLGLPLAVVQMAKRLNPNS